eukprot:TRINITY_DN2011_c2_g1_i1.p1 TRINITY_DN2011_c2_g1~~TRINITY_DN2011_c2_g1_i1.p1  ORF type:complete len:553 (+),score=126.27 TRINITY_DN2011_c2_g1_i1:110-1660(+)
MATVKSVASVFESYQKARVAFVQNVAELAANPKNIAGLEQCSVMSLLRPLLLDTVPSIQHNAAQALARLANYNAELASAVVSGDILPQLVYSLSEQNKFYKKAAASVLRSVAKHSPELAKAVVDSSAVDALVSCLEEFDPSVKENAAWAISCIAKHNPELAQACVDAGAVPLLVLCVQEPELSVKRIAASALSDIAKHTPELAQALVDAGVLPHLQALAVGAGASKEPKLKRQVFSCLGQLAKHSVRLAELVVDGDGLFPGVLAQLKDADPNVKKNVATLIREIVKHTPELAALVVNHGGAAALVDYVSDAPGAAKLPGVMALGYIAAFSELLARAVIDARGVLPVLETLRSEHEDHVRSAAAWALGQIGRHSSDHAKAVAEVNGFGKLLEALRAPDASDDLKTKARRALKAVSEKCIQLDALEPLLDGPPKVQQYVVHQFAKILQSDPTTRKEFVANGSLQKVLQLHAEPGSKLKDFLLTINSVYPEQVIQYYSPGFKNVLLAQVEDHASSQGGL